MGYIERMKLSSIDFSKEIFNFILRFINNNYFDLNVLLRHIAVIMLKQLYNFNPDDFETKFYNHCDTIGISQENHDRLMNTIIKIYYYFV